MYGQYAHCAENAGKYEDAYRNYEKAIHKFACMKNLSALDRMAIEYNTIREAYRTNTPFYELLYGGFENLYNYHTFLPRTSLPKIKGTQEAVIQKVEFPDDVRETGVEGTVWIAAMVDNNGMVKETGVQRSFGSFACERDALKQVKRQDYDPALIGTDPVTSWVSMAARYRYSSPIFQLHSQSLPLQTVPRPDSIYIKPGLPQLLIEGLNKFSKAKDNNEGYIRTALKINKYGLITDILLIENTMTENKERAEEDLVKLLSESIFDPTTVVSDSSHEVAYVATFIIDEDKKFALPEDTRLSLFMDKRKIKFPESANELEPDFQQAEELAEAFGAFRIRYRITPEGTVDDIQTIHEDINKGKLVDICRDTFKNSLYSAGTFDDSLKVAYKIRGYGFTAVDWKQQTDMVKKYNEGYEKLIKNDYSGAGKKFREVILSDRTGDFYSLIPQMLYSFKMSGEIKEGYKALNNLLRFHSLTGDLPAYARLVRTYSVLKYNAAMGNDFYAVLTDSSAPKKLFVLPEPNENSKLLSDSESLWKQVEYPSKKADEIRYGTVELMALVNEKQEIKDIKIIHSLGDGDYDDRAKDVIKKYARFSSAVYNGLPVPYWCRVGIKFEKPVTPEDMIPWWKKIDTAPQDSVPAADSTIVTPSDTTVSFTPDSIPDLKSTDRKTVLVDSASAFLNGIPQATTGIFPRVHASSVRRGNFQFSGGSFSFRGDAYTRRIPARFAFHIHED